MTAFLPRMGKATRNWWRRTGADFPGGDPLPGHGVATEGYLWRFTLPEQQQVVTVACTVNRDGRETWSHILVAAEPGALLCQETVAGGYTDRETFTIGLGRLLRYQDNELKVAMGDLRLEARMTSVSGWSRRTPPNGLAATLPFLRTYWHPYVLDGEVQGQLDTGSHGYGLHGAHVYAEKSWGRGFPARWWWGQAHGFNEEGLCVAYVATPVLPTSDSIVLASCFIHRENAGWHLPVLTNYAVRHEDHDGWTLTMHGRRHRIHLAGSRIDTPLPLSLPLPRTRELITAPQALRSRLTVRVERSTRVLLAAETSLASHESGVYLRRREQDVAR
ncbi:tocopherol cyclase family protein [Amycolatopsis japonica]